MLPCPPKDFASGASYAINVSTKYKSCDTINENAFVISDTDLLTKFNALIFKEVRVHCVLYERNFLEKIRAKYEVYRLTARRVSRSSGVSSLFFPLIIC